MPKQMECRIVITHRASDWRKVGACNTFSLGMYDPVSSRYEPLGTHPFAKIDGIVRDLKIRMEKEGHRVSFSELRGPR